MKLKKFFKELKSFYDEGMLIHTIDNKQYRVFCKYYVQANTFSYELFIVNADEFGEVNGIIDFTRKGDYRSEVFSFWNSKENREEIIEGIKESARDLELK